MGNDSYTKLLLHMDGANASTTFTDSSSGAKSVTAVGNAKLTTAQLKFGSASGYFDGSSRISIADSADWNFGTGDFTIDFWFKTSQSGSFGTFYSRTGSTGLTGTVIAVSQTSTNNVEFIMDANGGARYQIDSAAGYNDNAWHHCAAVRSGTSIYLYIDGLRGKSIRQLNKNIWL